MFSVEWRRIEIAVDGILNELVEAFDNPRVRPGKSESDRARSGGEVRHLPAAIGSHVLHDENENVIGEELIPKCLLGHRESVFGAKVQLCRRLGAKD